MLLYNIVESFIEHNMRLAYVHIVSRNSYSEEVGIQYISIFSLTFLIGHLKHIWYEHMLCWFSLSKEE